MITTIGFLGFVGVMCVDAILWNGREQRKGEKSVASQLRLFRWTNGVAVNGSLRFPMLDLSKYPRK